MHRYFIYCRKSTEDDNHQALSLESQKRELVRYAAQYSLEVVDIFFEHRTARSIGRPIFTHMMKRIAKGEARGILAWHPDRLARNAVDGGQVIHYLDTGKLDDLRFPTFIFENSPQGKFMLMIMFGHSKYEVDTLSEHVKRGNRTKRELGWLPGPAPLGYLNVRSDSGAKVIGRDPERFPIIQKLWNIFLTGAYSGADLLAAAKEMGLRSRRSWRSGGNLINESSLYHLLKNPFYTGHIIFKDRWYPGNHEPMITVDEFNHAQKLLRGKRTRPHSYRFAYTGLMRCGNCGCSITAEQHRNRYGCIYVYYHCTHGKPSFPCREKAIAERELEKQVIEFFAGWGCDQALISQDGIRMLLVLRASKVLLQNKRLHIEPKEIR